MELFVGTFNVPYLYTLSFDPHLAHLSVTHISNATAPHPWLSFAPNQKTLYAAAWEPASVAAYGIQRDDDSSHTLELINSKPVVTSPGYVTCTNSYLYSAGGTSGEVFRVESDGALGHLAQQLNFTTGSSEGVPTPGGVAGLANGTHSVDLSPEGDTLYVADIGSNGVWTFTVSEANGGPAAVLSDQQLHGAARDNDGPRHAWPHPNGKILYVIGQHSNMVDVFLVKKHGNGTVKDLEHLQSASVLPQGSNVTNYAADEVRFSTGPPGNPPQYLFASTRGRANNANGYVSAFGLDTQGKLVHTKAIDLWETPTSGCSANAIEPAPWVAAASPDTPFLQYLALTDDIAGKVRILTFDGAHIQELGAVTLEIPASDKETFNGTVQAATAVWLRPVRETA